MLADNEQKTVLQILFIREVFLFYRAIPWHAVTLPPKCYDQGDNLLSTLIEINKWTVCKDGNW